MHLKYVGFQRATESEFKNIIEITSLVQNYDPRQGI
jgi:hypothetical protein